MTQEQFYAEIAALRAKYQSDSNTNLTKDEIEAQKCLIDAAKELFIYHDYAKVQVYMTKAIGHLVNLQQK